jgi:predicted ester cyclase
MWSQCLTRSVFALAIGLALTLGISVRSGFAEQEVARETPRMSVEQTEATLSAYIDALLGGGPYESYFAEDVVVTVVGSGQAVTGRGEAKAWIDELQHVTFDAHLEMTSKVVGKGHAAVEATFVGTQSGLFAGIVPTGRYVAVPCVVFFEMADGQITALRIYGLVDGLAEQLTTASTIDHTRHRPGQPR